MESGHKTRRQVREERAAMMARQDFDAKTRELIRARDYERCVLCGRAGREVHHIIPRAQGGLGTLDNGVCLCSPCHHDAHRKPQVAKRLVSYRERVLLPLYEGIHEGGVPTQPLEEEGRDVCSDQREV